MSASGTAATVLDATDRLIGDLADAVHPLRAVGDALAALADGLGVEKVIIAIDDERLGRQVFCSGRVPLGDDGVGLRGPQGAWTLPPRILDAVATAVLLRAVGIGVVRSTARASSASLEVDRVAGDASGDPIADAVATATARALRHGWGFTLVWLRGGPELADVLRPRMRAADLLVIGTGPEIALLLPQTAGDQVPLVLARLSAAEGAPRFSYGLACCPADGTDPRLLARTAFERLEVAARSSDTATEAAVSSTRS
jgi:hypothetical protein